MNRSELNARLMELREDGYRDFMLRSLATVPKEKILGVRTPMLRNLAKEFSGSADAEAFLRDLPHVFFEENQIHMFLLGAIRDYDRWLAEIDAFLPYVDNWATCDQVTPRHFRGREAALRAQALKWMASGHPFTVRYGVGVLMARYLDADFQTEDLEAVAAVRSKEYYVNMMIAWYFATALAKQWDAAIPYLEAPRMEKWTHNKAIQKAIESSRITDAQKAHLRMLKI